MRYHLDPAGATVSNTGSREEPREAIARLEDEVAALRVSRRRLAAATHEQRRAIEREFHDGVQQHLVALAVDLQRLAGMIDRDGDAARVLVAEMRANLREALDEATRHATSTYPALADGRGLAAALRSAANEAGLVALVEVPRGADYPPEIAAALYWTWLDALAWAPRASESSIRVLDADGGMSFELTIAGQRDAGDLDGLRDRIEALDGRLSLDDEQDGSTRIQGWLPLPR
jgi:signal transduction histidine kinase